MIDFLKLYVRYPAWVLLVYGFSAGMPFKVLFAVVGYYLRQLGFDLTTITAITALALFYSAKFLWSPVLDGYIPGAATMGVRRISLLFTQSILAFLFFGLAFVDPHSAWPLFMAILVGIAFFGATQDIVIDALRIELMPPKFQGILTANYLLGYRVGLIVGISLPLYIAEMSQGWTWSFLVISLLFLPSILLTLWISEPTKPGREQVKTDRYWFGLYQTLKNACLEFSRRYGSALFSILATILLFRFCDLLLGVVAYPFYSDLGYSKIDVANYSGIMGVAVTLLGGLSGGYFLWRYSWRRLMLWGLVLAGASNLAFVALAMIGHAESLAPLILAIVFDNLAGGFATTIFIAWLSSLINLRFTAVQYAMLASLTLIPGKLFGASSGWLIDVSHHFLSERSGLEFLSLWHRAEVSDPSLMAAYALFFLLTSTVALPAMLAVICLPDSAVAKEREPSSAEAEA